MSEMTSEMLTSFTCDCGRRVPDCRPCAARRRERRVVMLVALGLLVVFAVAVGVRG